MEPAWADNAAQTAGEQAVWQEFDRIQHMSGDELMCDCVRIQLRPEVGPPAPPWGQPPQWMGSLPAGLKAMMHAFRTDELDLDALRSFHQPVYAALGGLSNPDYYQRMADRLATVFPNLPVEIYTTATTSTLPAAPSPPMSPPPSRHYGQRRLDRPAWSATDPR